MTDVAKKNPKENQIQAKPKIDSKAELIEPIDFSFKDLMTFDEIRDAQPRYPAKQEPKKIDGKYASLGLKLGYNALSDVAGLYNWCIESYAFPDKIATLDLSFNCFSDIPNEVMHFEGLKCLYLHGNKITNLAEIEKLKKLKNLTALAIHGNPIETLAAFRFYILSRLPELKHLNFGGISKADRQTALIWTKSNSKPVLAVIDGLSKKPKKPEDDDE